MRPSSRAVDAAIAVVAAKQSGNITRRQLFEIGLDKHDIGYRVKVGRLFRVFRGVYSVGRRPVTGQEWAAAAVLACGAGAALSHSSAMVLWGYWRHWEKPYEVTVVGDRRTNAIRIHRSTTLRRQDVTRQLGIRVTTPARTILDMSPRLGDRAFKRVVSNAVHSLWLTQDQLADAVSRHAHLPAAKRTAKLIGLPGTPTRSGWEDEFPVFCARYGLPTPVMGAPIGGYIVDALFVAERVIVELDSWTFHGDKIAFETDRERDACMLTRGFVTELVDRGASRRATARGGGAAARDPRQPAGRPASRIPRVVTSTRGDLDDVLVSELELWREGPPHELFRRLRSECPVHWTSSIPDYPGESGYWSVTRPEDIHTVSRDWRTYSSELGGITSVGVFPLELIRAMFIGMDPPRHDRLKMLFQAGFTPRRIAAHEPAIRAIVVDVLDRLHGRDECDLVSDVAQPVVSRVIGSFMGVPPEDDADWARLMNAVLGVADPDMSPRGVETLFEESIPELFARCRQLIAERRERPTDDLTSVLVHAEVEGEKLEEQEIVMGFFLLMAAGNDSTKATYCSGMRALLEQPDQRRRLLGDPALIPSAVEESLRMFPAFAHFARTATHDTELAGQTIREGEKVVMWYVSSGREEGRYEDPDRFDVGRNPEHQAFGAGGRHYCLGTALARLELLVLFEETLARYPGMELAGEPTWVASTFVNQLKTLPVRLGKAPTVRPGAGSAGR